MDYITEQFLNELTTTASMPALPSKTMRGQIQSPGLPDGIVDGNYDRDEDEVKENINLFALPFPPVTDPEEEDDDKIYNMEDPGLNDPASNTMSAVSGHRP